MKIQFHPSHCKLYVAIVHLAAISQKQWHEKTANKRVIRG